MRVFRFSAAEGEARTSLRPSRVASRQLLILLIRPSFSSSVGVGAANRLRFFSMIFNCVLNPGSSAGWKKRSKSSSTSHREIHARPTAVISLVGVVVASLFTAGASHGGTERHSRRILKARLLMAPSSREKRLIYSLSSSDVRDWARRW